MQYRPGWEGTIGCDAVDYLTFSIEMAAPPSAFYELVGQASAAAYGKSAAGITNAAKQCVRKAMRDPDTNGEITIAKLEMTCSVVTKAEGGVFFSINQPGR